MNLDLITKNEIEESECKLTQRIALINNIDKLLTRFANTFPSISNERFIKPVDIWLLMSPNNSETTEQINVYEALVNRLKLRITAYFKYNNLVVIRRNVLTLFYNDILTKSINQKQLTNTYHKMKGQM